MEALRASLAAASRDVSEVRDEEEADPESCRCPTEPVRGGDKSDSDGNGGGGDGGDDGDVCMYVVNNSV